MKQVIEQLEALITAYAERFKSISENDLSFKPGARKWSRKEIIGHLIDSAQNNIQRFVRAQYEHNPHIIYDQDIWVAAQDYQHYSTQELIRLWQLLNKHICIILKNIPPEMYERRCNTGKEEEQLHTIDFLAKDYVEHHLHHLKQII